MRRAVVLDLDETLIHTFGDVNALKKINLLKDTRHMVIRRDCYILDFYDARELKQFHLWGVKRPYLDNFLDYCFTKFDIVMVWTAGSADYADAVVSAIFNRKPHFIFSREHCREFKNHIIKPLKDLFDNEPDLKKLTSIDKMVMIDDCYDNFHLNKKNGILVRPFYPKILKNTIVAVDEELLIVQSYLDELMRYKNIGDYGHLFNRENYD